MFPFTTIAVSVSRVTFQQLYLEAFKSRRLGCAGKHPQTPADGTSSSLSRSVSFSLYLLLLLGVLVCICWSIFRFHLSTILHFLSFTLFFFRCFSLGFPRCHVLFSSPVFHVLSFHHIPASLIIPSYTVFTLHLHIHVFFKTRFYSKSLHPLSHTPNFDHLSSSLHSYYISPKTRSRSHISLSLKFP